MSCINIKEKECIIVMQKLPDETIHLRISKFINANVPLEVEYWKSSRKQANTSELSLYTLYTSVYRRVVEGKHFFGCGSWYEYLRRFHKVNSLASTNLPNERIDSLVQQKIKQILSSGEFSSLSAKHWQLESRASTPTGQSLAAIYSIAQSRKLKGKSFFGFGNWRAYLIHLAPEVANVMPAYQSKIRGKTITQQQINTVFRNAISKGVSLRSIDWRENPISKKGKIKIDYLALSRARKTLASRNYLGHGSYANYLQNVHGVSVPKKYVRRR